MFLKDAVQLLGATSLEATKFAEEVFHFEKRIAELTPNTEDILNPIKSIQIMNVADLQRQSFSVRHQLRELVVPFQRGARRFRACLHPLTLDFLARRRFLGSRSCGPSTRRPSLTTRRSY